MSKVCRILPIGPTIPSFYLDKHLENDNDYGLNLFASDSSICNNWLNTKLEGSVIYLSFGSMASLSNKQMEELAFALKGSKFHFLWVVKASEEAKLPEKFVEEVGNKGLVLQWCSQLEVLSNKAIVCFLTHCGWNSTLKALSLRNANSGGATMDRSNYECHVVKDFEEAKLPEKFVEEIGNKGLVVQWCFQMEVLSNKAIGCFLTHCGWNSTLEALSFGVPMVGCHNGPIKLRLPSMFKMCGKWAKVCENGIVEREEIYFGIKEVMEGERGKDFLENAKKWRDLAIKAISEGGSSDKNIDEFVSKFINS
nr:udp-glycosyltransferase 74f1 [Quercus suber]